MLNIVEAVVQGVLLGGLYTLFAAGLSLVFGVMRLVNIAHGDFIVLGAYIALAVVGLTGLHPFLSLVVVVPLIGPLRRSRRSISRNSDPSKMSRCRASRSSRVRRCTAPG